MKRKKKSRKFTHKWFKKTKNVIFKHTRSVFKKNKRKGRKGNLLLFCLFVFWWKSRGEKKRKREEKIQKLKNGVLFFSICCRSRRRKVRKRKKNTNGEEDYKVWLLFWIFLLDCVRVNLVPWHYYAQWEVILLLPSLLFFSFSVWCIECLTDVCVVEIFVFWYSFCFVVGVLPSLFFGLKGQKEKRD